MATIVPDHWTLARNWNFDTAGLWSTGTVANYDNLAIFDAAGPDYTVTVSSSDAVHMLQTDSNVTISVTGGFAVKAGTGAGASAGTITVASNAGLEIGGTFANTGLVELALFSRLDLHGNAYFTGGGVVSITGSIYGGYDSPGSILNNVDNTFSGQSVVDSVGDSAGAEIRGTGATLVNDANGIIEDISINYSYATITNTGSIRSTSATGKTVMSPEFSVQGVAIGSPVNNTGTIIADGGTLNLIGGGTTNSGLVEASDSSDLDIGSGIYTQIANTATGVISAVNGGRVLLDSATISGGTLTTSSGGVIELLDSQSAHFTPAVAALDGTSMAVTNDTTVQVPGAGTLTLYGTITGPGVIALESAAGGGAGQPTYLDIGAFGFPVPPGATLSGGGSVTLDPAGREFIIGAGGTTLTLDDSTISGAGVIIAPMIVNGAGGLIEATASNLFLRGATIDGSAGGVIAAAGGAVQLQGVDVIGGTLTSSASGVIFAQSGANILDGRASAVTVNGRLAANNGLDLTLEGTIANSGLTSINGGTKVSGLTVGAAGASLTGGGQIYLARAPTDEIVGASSAATLTNVNERITGGGMLGGGQMMLVNQAGGVIDANAGTLVVDTGANTILNAGLIDASYGGVGTVASAVDNTGRLLAAIGGTSLTFEAPVTGSGSAAISHGVLAFASSFDENVTFNGGSTGTLALAQSQAYGGVITGFSKTGATSLDLEDIAFSGQTTASYAGTAAGGTLTVSDGTHTASIKLGGNYLASTFTASGDGHGGTTIVDPTPQRFAAAMAGFGAGAPPGLHGGMDHGVGASGLSLATPGGPHPAPA